MTTMLRKFNSLSEFVEHADGPSEVPNYDRSSQRKGRDDFHATASFEDAKRVAFNWPEGVARIERVRARIALKSQRVRKEVVSREAGPGVVAMGKFIAGHPQPYMALVDGKRAAKGKGKIVRVVLNCTVSAGIDREIIETRGAAVLALVAALEQSGKRVEIVVAYKTARKGHACEYHVTVKRAQARLNLNSVAFALANPDMLRRFMFATEEREDAKFLRRMGVVFSGLMGMPTDVEVPDGAIYLPAATYGEDQWSSEENAAAWVRETLEAQGVAIR